MSKQKPPQFAKPIQGGMRRVIKGCRVSGKMHMFLRISELELQHAGFKLADTVDVKFGDKELTIVKAPASK